MNNLIIGSHVSFKKDDQLIGCVNETLSYNANAFMFYTGAPQNTARVPINDNLTLEAMNMMKENGLKLENVVVHAPYIINPANNEKKEFTINFFRNEIERVEQLGVKNIVLHPGSHVGVGTQKAITNIAFVLNSVLLSDTNVTICLETMAGKGTEVGINFDELKQIIDKVRYNDKVKVCMDTCHLNDAGYDLSDFDKILDEFDEKIGLEKLAVIHINDSKNVLGAHKDRHENIGFGTIGFENLIKIIYNKRIENVPKILETPYTPEKKNPPYKFEIEMIKNKKMDENLINNIDEYYK